MINFIFASVMGIVSCIKRNSKIIFLLFFVFLFCIISGNTTSNDRTTYMYIYKNTNSLVVGSDIEIGFQVLMLVAKQFKLSFQSFCTLIAIIIVTLYSKTIYRLSVNPAIVVFSYFLFPFVLDAEQLRSALGQAIVLIGLTNVINKKENGVKRYVICCVIASLIHTSCILFLLYLLINIDKKFIKSMVIGACVMLAIGRNLILAIASRVSIVNLEKASNYFLEADSKSNVMVYIIYNCVLLIVVLYFARKKIMLPQNINSDEQAVYKLNILSFFYIALLMINANFERLLRPIFILDYIFLSNLLPKKINKAYQLFILCFLLLFPGVRMLTLLTGGGYNSLIIPMFYEGFFNF